MIVVVLSFIHFPIGIILFFMNNFPFGIILFFMNNFLFGIILLIMKFFKVFGPIYFKLKDTNQ